MSTRYLRGNLWDLRIFYYHSSLEDDQSQSKSLLVVRPRHFSYILILDGCQRLFRRVKKCALRWFSVPRGEGSTFQESVVQLLWIKI